MPQIAMIKISVSSSFRFHSLCLTTNINSARKLSVLPVGHMIFTHFSLPVGVCGTADNCFVEIPFTGTQFRFTVTILLL